MSDLLTCPFCGGKAKLEHDTDGSVYIDLYHKDYCFLDGVDTLQWFYPFDGKTAEEVATESWNTRAERTCEIVHDDALSEQYEDPMSKCLCCGAALPEEFIGPYYYCPNCGAKVVE